MEDKRTDFLIRLTLKVALWGTQEETEAEREEMTRYRRITLKAIRTALGNSAKIETKP